MPCSLISQEFTEGFSIVNTHYIKMEELDQEVILSMKDSSPLITEDSSRWFKTTMLFVLQGQNPIKVLVLESKVLML